MDYIHADAIASIIIPLTAVRCSVGHICASMQNKRTLYVILVIFLLSLNVGNGKRVAPQNFAPDFKSALYYRVGLPSFPSPFHFLHFIPFSFTSSLPPFLSSCPFLPFSLFLPLPLSLKTQEVWGSDVSSPEGPDEALPPNGYRCTVS